jgi:light-regulated signal transduction histidine kinase (bacteriophytochrome)
MVNLDGAIRESGAHIIDRGLPVLYTDPRIEHVFQNLILNAIRYRRKDVAPEIAVSAEKEGDVWTFSVQDNGVGIEPEYYERVFEIFRRLHGNDIPGNGLGLALCRKIIDASGGRIWVESQPGSGSTFRFTLPVKAHVA